MTDAPERIWAFDARHIGAITHGEWADCIRHGGGDEYVRADLHAAAVARAEAAEQERDRFEAALGRACLVGGTAYLAERVERAEAGLAEARAEMIKDQRRLNAASWRRRWWQTRAKLAEAALAVAGEALRKIDVGEGWAAHIARAAIVKIAAMKGGNA